MKVTEYVVEYEDPADRGAFVVNSLEQLQEWLEETVGDKRIARAILHDVRTVGRAEYRSDAPYDEPKSFGLAEEDLAELDLPTVDLLRIMRRTIKVSDAEGVLRALHKINRHRGRTGQPMLDPIDAGWTIDDVLREAQRIG